MVTFYLILESLCWSKCSIQKSFIRTIRNGSYPHPIGRDDVIGFKWELEIQIQFWLVRRQRRERSWRDNDRASLIANIFQHQGRIQAPQIERVRKLRCDVFGPTVKKKRQDTKIKFTQQMAACRVNKYLNHFLADWESRFLSTDFMTTARKSSRWAWLNPYINLTIVKNPPSSWWVASDSRDSWISKLPPHIESWTSYSCYIITSIF